MLPDTMTELLEGFMCLGCEVLFQDIERYQTHRCSDYDDDEEYSND